MAKVLLVEDDNNLREIYEARLMAEGYDIASARDGEEALVVAKAEHPDLVISDVMMPKISGFEMLDILRNTDGMKDLKVIMLTALGQAEDQTRADKLGADRYLVKSQVTLEDIVTAAQELLSGEPAEAAAPAPEAPEPEAPAPVAEPAPAPVATPTIPMASPPVDTPPAAAPAPVTPEPVEPPATPIPEPTTPEPVAPARMPAPTADEPAPDQPEPTAAPAPEPAAPAVTPPAAPAGSEPLTEAQETATVEQQIEDFVNTQSGTPAPAVEPAPAPAAVEPETTAPTTTPEQEQALNEAVDSLSGAPAPASEPAAAPEPAPQDDEPVRKRVIEPLQDDAPKKSLDELLAAEDAKEKGTPTPSTPPTPPKPANPNDFDPNSISL